MYKDFKYRPEEYPYPLNEDISKVYKAYQNDRDYLEGYIGDVHLTLKQAAVAGVLDEVTVREMQVYFWGLLDD